MSLLRLRDRSATPPKGFRWHDPITGFDISARNHANWTSQATAHRVANSLESPSVEEMEHQLCESYDAQTRINVCLQDDGYIPKPGGPGNILKNRLQGFGIKACWGCLDLAGKMDAWGPEGCEENMQYIVDAMQANADQRKWMRFVPFKEMGCRALVEWAITEARNQLAQSAESGETESLN